MSSRHRARLREEAERLARAREPLSATAENAEESEDDSEDEPRQSGFGFLQSDSDSDDSEEEEEEEEEAGASSSKSCAKGDGGKQVNSGQRQTLQRVSKAKEEEEMLEAAIAEVSNARGSRSGGVASNKRESLYAVSDLRTLNPDFELGQKLGKAAAEAVRSGQQGEVMRRSGNHRNSKNMVGRSKRKFKSLFITMEENAIPPPVFASGMGGARMNLLGDTEDGGVLFSFEASDSYRVNDKTFGHVEATMDPNNIVAFLNEHPFHVPALLQLCNVYLQTAQLEQAEMMLRRSLFVLEAWLHPRFSELLQQGRCRLKDTRVVSVTNGIEDEDVVKGDDCYLNETFIDVLFKQMLVSRRRGCFKTAFALGRVLLGLHPDSDPKRVLLVLDQLALLSGADDFVVDFFKENDRCQVIPGMHYSYALALHRLGREIEANDAIEEAIRKHPGTMIALIEQVGKTGVDITNGMVESALGTCKKLDVQNSSFENKLVSFFVQTNIQTWSSSPRTGSSTPPYLWAAFRATNLSTDSKEESDQVEVEDEKAIQKMLKHYATVNFSQYVDDTGAVNMDDLDFGGAAGAQRIAPNVDMNSSLVQLFFQTLMPWSRLPDSRDPPPPDGADN
uniref:Transcription factor 25 n=1 Tax=Mucochytrium quahogii TaxID=96639 RepID=A0A7S2SJJ5_9STRA|mmetsp:Transcript_11896/g.21881  ORF Transcript_11896/g.21881 Transcript_11896/m.21881 type:complete len:618 (-) Transcript_11896:1300-3153(-)|eukprot:CAMPEP_0203762958 /NCGR_PEP_ID=MMETSP0098-20131031/15715_1 /ASSEMBLY_ACC=CAM_ASM_000208 /TAXON_ID=96639 /ORGANISM=" , Strain NY0313808BC1" /LENGTH=617 /DNA_ID=CAMNT_0050657559 /DNA_START=604 /DNA_END=2457 /DNA_ORIENTATION=+